MATDLCTAQLGFCYRLGSHICGYKCFQIELSRGYDYVAFHDDLKKLYDMAGVQNLDTTFLFTDTQVCLGRACCHLIHSYAASIFLHWNILYCTILLGIIIIFIN